MRSKLFSETAILQLAGNEQCEKCAAAASETNFDFDEVVSHFEHFWHQFLFEQPALQVGDFVEELTQLREVDLQVGPDQVVLHAHDERLVSGQHLLQPVRRAQKRDGREVAGSWGAARAQGLSRVVWAKLTCQMRRRPLHHLFVKNGACCKLQAKSCWLKRRRRWLFEKLLFITRRVPIFQETFTSKRDILRTIYQKKFSSIFRC